MSRSFKRFALPALVATVLTLPAISAVAFEGVGRVATPSEIAKWDIDVRPDFAGLPAGEGSVVDGETLWIEKCSSCHGDFGDANHVFAPLIGNTTLQDIETGRVAALTQPGVRTTMMKVPTVSTLWDFINRAMPWDKPKSLSPNEVYAIVAYMLSLAEVVPYDFVLNQDNISSVQERMPNRNGMTTDHGMWEIDGKPDTKNKACMKNCKDAAEISSFLPDFARSAHGELVKQNREYGAIRGARTTDEPLNEDMDSATSAPTDLLGANACLGCHGMEAKLVGPGFSEIADKYKDRQDSVTYFSERIRNGGSGNWGAIPMPPQPQLKDEEIKQLADWLAAGAPH
ncbi:MAG: c-type cytochrome [Xanthomonadales bacterium]|jgi:cytochrome c551/c552|nr:c-type cytochrome [Xanthomonadales bacterium]